MEERNYNLLTSINLFYRSICSGNHLFCLQGRGGSSSTQTFVESELSDKQKPHVAGDGRKLSESGNTRAISLFSRKLFRPLLPFRQIEYHFHFYLSWIVRPKIRVRRFANSRNFGNLFRIICSECVRALFYFSHFVRYVAFLDALGLIFSKNCLLIS